MSVMRCKSILISALLAGSVGVFAVPLFGQSYGEQYKRCFEGDLPDKVIAACSAVIARGGDDSTEIAAALKKRGDAYDDKHSHELALKDYDQALALNPHDPDLLNSRGTIWTALERYDRAIDDFSRALELKPSLAMALSNRCFARACSGQLETALADCNEALHLRAKSPDAMAARAFVYLKLNRAADAVKDYDAVLSERGDDPYSLFGRAAAKYMKGDLRGADGDVVRAQTLKPDIVEHMARHGIQLQASR